MRLRWHLRWAAPTLVLGIAAALRFWALGTPGTLVFDELYYVRDAISQLTHGFPTIWPDDESDMSGSRATAFTDDPENAVHPPLGKWLIGLGILVFGPESGWGWRSAVAIAGVLTVAITMRLGWLISRSLVIAYTAGLALAIDGVHVVLTRVGLLDGFLTMFIALGALFVWKDYERGAADSLGAAVRIRWRRPWLLAAGAAFGAAAAVKWSGLYPLAFFLVLVTICDLIARLRHARAERQALPTHATPPPRGRGTAVLAAALQATVTAVIALPSAAIVYLASWAGWIVNPGGWDRTPGVSWPAALVKYHAEMLTWHSTLSAPHPYAAHPLTWPLALRPTGMYETRWGAAQGCQWAECVSGISPLPNPLITWGGVAALAALAWIVVRACRGLTQRVPTPILAAGAFVLVGYLSGWLPWVLTFSRPAVFQFYAVVLTPFSALALALVVGLVCGIPIRGEPGTSPPPGIHSVSPGASAPASGAALGPDRASLQGRRIAVILFLAISLALAIWFFPVWSGAPVAEWFWRAHLWLPGWI